MGSRASFGPHGPLSVLDWRDFEIQEQIIVRRWLGVELIDVPLDSSLHLWAVDRDPRRRLILLNLLHRLKPLDVPRDTRHLRANTEIPHIRYRRHVPRDTDPSLHELLSQLVLLQVRKLIDVVLWRLVGQPLCDRKLLLLPRKSILHTVLFAHPPGLCEGTLGEWSQLSFMGVYRRPFGRELADHVCHQELAFKWLIEVDVVEHFVPFSRNCRVEERLVLGARVPFLATAALWFHPS